MRGERPLDPKEFLAKGKLVVVAGAGVSAGPPSRLPGWDDLNGLIARELDARIGRELGDKWLRRQAAAKVARERDGQRFPPAYQAQVIHEMCGERYFHALQALDVDVTNPAHEGIAALAATGAVRAVVTTNFDRLVEQALARRGVDHVVVRSDAEFEDAARRARDPHGPLLVVKVHGCVSDAASMVDTLKQRQKGRSALLRACLDALHDAPWLYLGFSAADLDVDPTYLGLLEGARRSPGALYVLYPGSPEGPRPSLGRGATALKEAYGERGSVIVEHVAEVMARLCEASGAPAGGGVAAAGASSGRGLVEERVRAWAEGLSLPAAGLCLAAVLEACGEAEDGVRALLAIRGTPGYHRHGPDYDALQLHLGRLGAAWGRFTNVGDLHGEASNAFVESDQSLMRVANKPEAFAAFAWRACALLWLGRGEQAQGYAAAILEGFAEESWSFAAPRNDEEMTDAWLAAAQVLLVDHHEALTPLIVATSGVAARKAKESGDVVREARVAALRLALLAEAGHDTPTWAGQDAETIARAAEVGDRWTVAFHDLALGRHHLGHALRAPPEARRGHGLNALTFLFEARDRFAELGMDPWWHYAQLQVATALIAKGNEPAGTEELRVLAQSVVRFPALVSHWHEAVGRAVFLQGGGEEALEVRFRKALETALEAGLHVRAQHLAAILGVELEPEPETESAP